MYRHFTAILVFSMNMANCLYASTSLDPIKLKEQFELLLETYVQPLNQQQLLQQNLTCLEAYSDYKSKVQNKPFKSFKPNKKTLLLIPKAQGSDAYQTLNNLNFDRFINHLEQISNDYTLTENMLYENLFHCNSLLTDQHTSYLNKDMFKSMQDSMSNSFIGIGAILNKDKTSDPISIKKILPGSDALGKLEPNDTIIAVENKNVEKLDLSTAVDLLRGIENTPVNITISRNNQHKTYTVLRKKIEIPNISSYLLEKKYAYIKINAFTQRTSEDTTQAIIQLSEQSNNNLAGIILDLRDNPGGLLTESLELATVLTDLDTMKFQKKLLSIKERYDERIYYAPYTDNIPEPRITQTKTAQHILKNLPIVVLINQYSASASEIISGVLQDHERADLIGEKTYGKGSVQSIFPGDDGSALKVTIAKYYLPSGRTIDQTGVKPDETVKACDNKMPTDLSTIKSYTELKDKDCQLFHAIQSLERHKI